MKWCKYGPWGCIQNTQFSLQLTNGSNKLEWKGLPGTNMSLLGPFGGYDENGMLLIRSLKRLSICKLQIKYLENGPQAVFATFNFPHNF